MEKVQADPLAALGALPAAPMARMLGITPRRLQQLVAEGHVAPTGRGQYPVAATVSAYADFLRRAVQGGDEGRKRLVGAKAEMAEMELRRRSGELLDASAVMATWSQHIAECRTRLLAVPTKCAPLVAVESDPAAARQIIEDEVHAALDELARDSGTSGAGGSEGGMEEPAAADRQRVGRPRKKAKR